MKVFIQKIDGEFYNPNTFAAFKGFQKKGYKIEFYQKSDIPKEFLKKEDIVVGGIKPVRESLEFLGVKLPDICPIPEILNEFAGRKVYKSTMQEARNIVETGGEIFVKPAAEDTKLFNGVVFRKFADTISTAHIPAQTNVICSEVVSFISEYRVFVIRGEIVGMKHYKGNCGVFPDFEIVKNAVKKYGSWQAGYGIDFGVTDSNKTLLVEINDGYSLGCYGLDPLIYAALLEARWNELVENA